MTTAAAQGPARVPTPRQKQQSLDPLDVSVSNKSTTGITGQAKSLSPTSTSPTSQVAGGASGSGNNNSNGQGNGNGGGGRRGARNGHGPPLDPLSDRATATLIRRILCPQQLDKAKSNPESIEGLLPPLTSRNDVDLQLYGLIAIILREYVQNWYSKITPDETFVAEIVQLIAHCTRALEQRLRKVDLESLLLDEIPDLLDKHITAYRAAHNPITQPPIKTNPREIYHSLCPLPALSPVPRPGSLESSTEQAQNEAAYRQLLVHGVLAILLPTEDLENDCLTALVGQILAELIIGNNVANKLSEPWLILELLLVVTRVVERRNSPQAGDNGQSKAVSGAGKIQISDPTDSRKGFSAQAIVWSIVHWCFIAISLVRMIFTILVASRSLPRRTSRGLHDHDDGASRHKTGLAPIQDAKPSATTSGPVVTPVLAFRCWPAISNLLEMDVRMPWLCGTLAMMQWITTRRPGRMAGADGVIDRLLSHTIHRYLLDPAGLPPLLRNVRGALFPNNMPGTPTLTPPSSELELRALRRRCARAIWTNLVPSRRVGRLYFGGNGAGAGAPSLSDEAFTPQQSRTAPRNGGGRGGSGQQGLGQGTTNANDQANKGDGGKDRKKQKEKEKDKEKQGKNPYPAASSQIDEKTPVGGATDSTKKKNPDKGLKLDEEKGEEEDEDELILQDIEQGILDVFSDEYCNKHLIYSLLELILVRLMPELAEKGITELWSERVIT
ncbi:PXA domain containing protein [Naviculisporaceae sp. PSN 640]